MDNTIQKGSEKCEHSFELMNVAGLPEEVIFICPKCGTPQEGKITIKKPMTQTNTTQNKEELEIRFIDKNNKIMIAKVTTGYIKKKYEKELSQAHQSVIEEERKRIRQWLNEKPEKMLVTNEDIEEWLFDFEPLRGKK